MVIGADVSVPAKVRTFFASLDTDGDGAVSFEEFLGRVQHMQRARAAQREGGECDSAADTCDSQSPDPPPPPPCARALPTVPTDTGVGRPLQWGRRRGRGDTRPRAWRRAEAGWCVCVRVARALSERRQLPLQQQYTYCLGLRSTHGRQALARWKGRRVQPQPAPARAQTQAQQQVGARPSPTAAVVQPRSGQRAVWEMESSGVVLWWRGTGSLLHAMSVRACVLRALETVSGAPPDPRLARTGPCHRG